MELLKLEDYQDLESRKVIEYFGEISKIPRKSGEERQIREYLEMFAKKRNLEYIKDEYENIIIYKKATKGRENEETLAFQAHTDMICEKDVGVEHDFSKDPILLYKEGDYITAKGTTLGADNGIGVAYMLALLDSDISIPNLECIFTVQEETTMIGAIKIDEKNIQSRKIISLDNGKEGKILISSANCNEWIGRLEANKESSKAVSTLLNTENWTAFVNEYADYAIGGPTLQMWIASWNEKYNENIEIRVAENGYEVKVDGTANWSAAIDMKNKEGYTNELYFPKFTDASGNTRCNYWLSSQGQQAGSALPTADIYQITDGEGQSIYATYSGVGGGFRPVVSLKANQNLVKENGVWNIVK